MDRLVFRPIFIRIGAFVLTFTIGFVAAYSHLIYVNRQTVFIMAAGSGDIFRMRVMYRLGVDVNAPACKYRRCLVPIVAAASAGEDDAIQFLLDRHANVNAPMKSGKTALMLAAYNNHLDTVRLLLAHGADVNDDSEGDTALTWAKLKGNVEIVEMLKAAGARDKP